MFLSVVWTIDDDADDDEEEEGSVVLGRRRWSVRAGWDGFSVYKRKKGVGKIDDPGQNTAAPVPKRAE